MIADPLRLEEIISSFDGSKILVIGDVMIDHYLEGFVKKISPEAPVPVVNVKREYNTLGGAGNVAANIASLNTTTNFICVTGVDRGSATINKLLKSRNIEGTIIKEEGILTTTKSRVIGMNQQLLRLDYETTNEISRDTEKRIISEIKSKYLKKVSVIVVSDYKKGMITRNLLESIISIANNQDIKTIIDPKPDTIPHCKNSYLVTPNNHESAIYTKKNVEEDEEVIVAGKNISRRLKSNVLITRGEYGMALFERKKKPFMIPSKARHVYDVTGAGDTSVALIALSLTGNANLREATEISNIGAGIVVQKPGTQTLTYNELKAEIRGMKHDKSS